ncbi:Hypothetical protein Minf_2286 [Methylacidiphilum infernorum V4]|uniref:Uncharacterized protein n=1 Tax=Methylacidiphilum infernorum (isolate V4) TaxID=481448 RepID=B3E0B1_METI4|nr:Hypothetical protein Minf_2286 [Methylacidiphilum infernorum V4]
MKGMDIVDGTKEAISQDKSREIIKGKVPVENED